MIEYIDKQSLLSYLEENWPENWTDSEIEVQEQWDWNDFYSTVADFPSVDPGEAKEDTETYAEICIDSYYDPEQFNDFIVEVYSQCCICEQEFPGTYATIKFNSEGKDAGWTPEEKIFETENQAVEQIKKKVIGWNYCPKCGRKIKGYCGKDVGTLTNDDV